MDKVFNTLLSKWTFLELKEQFVLEQNLKYKSEALYMIIQCPVVYKYVIHKYQDILPHVWCKNGVH
jgi:hypothetical protein